MAFRPIDLQIMIQSLPHYAREVSLIQNASVLLQEEIRRKEEKEAIQKKEEVLPLEESTKSEASFPLEGRKETRNRREFWA